MSVFDPVYETFAKRIVYLANPTENPIVLRALTNAGYRIDRVFNDPVTDFQALGLTSLTPEKPPVLVFKGGIEQADDAAFIDRRGVAFNQFEANKTTIGNWLSQISQDAVKNPRRLQPDVIGHSMAGALAQRAAAEFTNSIGETITFNSPGIDRVTANIFKQKGGATKPVTHYIVNGDYVSLGGEEFIPGQVILQSYTNPQIDPRFLSRKHGEIAGLLVNPPPGYTQRNISVDQLNNPNFNFNNDSDFAEFITALAVTQPQLAASFSNRTSAEQFRTSGASFLGARILSEQEVEASKPLLMVGDNADNSAFGLEGNDTIVGNGGNDTLFGNQQNDLIYGGDGNDILHGGKDSDTLYGNQGNDVIYGDQGNDVLFGGKNNDILYGNQGDDILNGDIGNDTLYGGQNNDSLSGGDGDDILKGDFGNDTLSGGGGRDVFVLGALRGADVVLDFQDGQDLLGLAGGLTFAQLSIAAGNNGTQIRVASTNELLASLTGVQVSAIAASDFTPI
jgi:serralysin